MFAPYHDDRCTRYDEQETEHDASEADNND